MLFFKKHNLTKYISGNGIEIGALHNPIKINPKKANVKYVDAFDINELIIQNPEISKNNIKKPDIIGDAENLDMFADESLDFIIAAHILEHLPNPIKALKEFHRVLKVNAILYLAIPDKRFSFDKDRNITPLSHLLEDYKNSATIETNPEHYKEWFEFIESKKKKPLVKNYQELLEKKFRIHFHIWTIESILELLNYARTNLEIYFNLEDYYYRKNDADVVFILKKTTKNLSLEIPQTLKEKYSKFAAILQIAQNFRSSILNFINRN